MKALPLIAALILAGPAYAIPPVLPQETQDFIQAYIRADTAADITGYAKLFSADAKIVTAGGGPIDRAQWMTAQSEVFGKDRHVRFLDVFANGTMAEGKPLLHVVFVEAVKDCRAHLVECFPVYRTETVTVRDGRIVTFEQSEGLIRRFTADGAWVNFE